jgi:hypothetical protein
MPQIQKINTIFAIFRAFSIIWIFIFYFSKDFEKSRKFWWGVGVGGKGGTGGDLAVGG